MAPEAFKFLDDPFEAFLELAAVHGAGDQRADVQLQDALVQQGSGYVAFQDALRQAFHDGGLPHARFTDQRGVVFGAARQISG